MPIRCGSPRPRPLPEDAADRGAGAGRSPTSISRRARTSSCSRSKPSPTLSVLVGQNNPEQQVLYLVGEKPGQRARPRCLEDPLVRLHPGPPSLIPWQGLTPPVQQETPRPPVGGRLVDPGGPAGRRRAHPLAPRPQECLRGILIVHTNLPSGPSRGPTLRPRPYSFSLLLLGKTTVALTPSCSYFPIIPSNLCFMVRIRKRFQAQVL